MRADDPIAHQGSERNRAANADRLCAGGGDLFITVSYTDPDELPNFYALYRLYGFEPIPGLVLEDEARTDAYYESIPNLIPTMLTTDATGTLVAAGV